MNAKNTEIVKKFIIGKPLKLTNGSSVVLKRGRRADRYIVHTVNAERVERNGNISVHERGFREPLRTRFEPPFDRGFARRKDI